MGFVLIPTVGFSVMHWLGDETSETENIILVAEAAVYSGLLNQATKFLLARERPFVHNLSELEKKSTPDPADNNLSFYSGHTNLSFSMAIAFAQIFKQMQMPKYLSWGLVGMATATGYLRIAADKHYATDVLVGAVTGSLFALSITQSDIPQSENTAFEFIATPNWAAINYSF